MSQERFKKMWLEMSASCESLKVLDGVKDLRWVLDAVLRKPAQSPLEVRALLEYGLRSTDFLTSEELKQANDLILGFELVKPPGCTAPLSAAEACAYRRRFLEALDRLNLWEQLYTTDENFSEQFPLFRDARAVDITVRFALFGKIKPLVLVYKVFQLETYQLFLARCIPPAIDPETIKEFLPRLDNDPNQLKVSKRAEDWSEDADIITPLFIDYPICLNSCIPVNKLGNREEIQEWYLERALEIDSSGGFLSQAASLLNIAVSEFQLLNLTWLRDLSECLRKFVYNCSSSVEMIKARLKDFVKMSFSDFIYKLIKKSRSGDLDYEHSGASGNFVEYLVTGLVIEYLCLLNKWSSQDQEFVNKQVALDKNTLKPVDVFIGDLLGVLHRKKCNKELDILVTKLAASTNLAEALSLDIQDVIQRVILTEKVVVDFEVASRILMSTSIHDQETWLLKHITPILQRHGIGVPVVELKRLFNDNCEGNLEISYIINQIIEAAYDCHEAHREDDFEKMIIDIMNDLSVLIHLYSLRNPSETQKTLFPAEDLLRLALRQGEFQVAANIIDGEYPQLPQEFLDVGCIQEVAVSVAQEFIDSSMDADPQGSYFKEAIGCLNLPPVSPKIVEKFGEMKAIHLLTVVHRLPVSRESNLVIIPSQICAAEDKSRFVIDLLWFKPSLYSEVNEIIQLVQLLSGNKSTPRDEARVLIKVIEYGIQKKDYTVSFAMFASLLKLIYSNISCIFQDPHTVTQIEQIINLFHDHSKYCDSILSKAARKTVSRLIDLEKLNSSFI